jgi:peptidoglycan/xylan/chitin deacetylase (PgdA/CDA1 family)
MKKQSTKFKLFIPLFSIFFILISAFVLLPLPGTIPVLMYHYIGIQGEAETEGNFIHREEFAKQMAFLSLFKYRVLTLDQYYEIKTGKRKPLGREILITFDDGHKSFKELGLPLLQKYSLPSSMFVVSDYAKVGQGDYMSEEEVEDLVKSSLVTIGSHSKSHASLSKLESHEIWKELLESKKDLEQMLGIPIQYFVYPFGDFDSQVAELTKKAGYRLAFTTGHKRLKGKNEDLFYLTRIKISRVSNNPIVFWYHISGLHQYIKSTRKKMRRFFP